MEDHKTTTINVTKGICVTFSLFDNEIKFSFVLGAYQLYGACCTILQQLAITANKEQNRKLPD